MYVSGFGGSQAVLTRPSSRSDAHDNSFLYDVGRAAL
jgi:hypothetical protein